MVLSCVCPRTDMDTQVSTCEHTYDNTVNHVSKSLRLCSLAKIDLRERERMCLGEFESEWCVIFFKGFKGD